MDAALHTRQPAAPSRSPLTAAACTPVEEVLATLGSGRTGLTATEAARRQATYGPNAVATHAARLGPVLWQQLRSPLLGLLVAAATASYFVGERTDAVIIGVIVALSVGLGLANEYRAEKAAEALHSRITHRAVAVRSGQFTLTEGRISFIRAVPLRPEYRSEAVLRQALACVEVELDETGRAVAGNALDVALWNSPAAAAMPAGAQVLATLPFDHERRLASVLVADAAGAVTLVTKGAPESVLARCRAVPPGASVILERELGAGNRVVAVASRPMPAAVRLEPADERDLDVLGVLVFLDPPKPDAPDALRRLAELGIAVKVLTGDSPIVATRVCQDLGLGTGRPLTGTDIDAFFRSRPSLTLTLAVLAVVATGALLPATPLAVPLGFQPLPGAFFGALAGMVVAYLVLIEVGKWLFYRLPGPASHRRHLRRRAAYFSTADAAA